MNQITGLLKEVPGNLQTNAGFFNCKLTTMDEDKFVPKSSYIWVIVPAIVIIFLSFWFPVVMLMNNNGLSHDPEDWSFVSAYYSMILTLTSTIGLFALGFRVYRSQRARDKWELSQRRPELHFVYAGAKYYLYNMGGGTALNVYVGRVPISDKPESKYQLIKSFRCYSIPSNSHLILGFSDNSHILYAFYIDNERKRYLLKIEGDINEHIKLDEQLIQELENMAERCIDMQLVPH